jgi:metal-responsive CopG/Arc/MetJ family transcriptional regulator
MSESVDSSVKIAISLPPDLLEAADQKRQDRGETRSEFFRHAVEALLRREQEQEAVQRYLQGYRAQSETDEEVEAMHRASSAVFEQAPWT